MADPVVRRPASRRWPLHAALIGAVLLPLAPAEGASGDVAAGQARAEQCLACHGAHGVSEMPGVPSLAGQTNSFLQWQLVFFRSGRRKNELMSPMAAELSDEDVRNLGAYFASLPKPGTPPVEQPDDALRAHGQEVAEQHHCSNCHMDDFHGKGAAANIARQREDYLVKALADYRSSARPSTGVAAMTEAASGLSDDDIKALAHYLGSL